jgi:hypothetical protein
MRKYLIFMFCLLFGVCLVSCKSRGARTFESGSEGSTNAGDASLPQTGTTSTSPEGSPEVSASKGEASAEALHVSLEDLIEIVSAKLSINAGKKYVVIEFKNTNTGETKQVFVKVCKAIKFVNAEDAVTFARVVGGDSLACCVFRESRNRIGIGFFAGEFKRAQGIFENCDNKIKLEYGNKLFISLFILQNDTHSVGCLKKLGKIQKSANPNDGFVCSGVELVK